jgi:hypothetical protein
LRGKTDEKQHTGRLLPLLDVIAGVTGDPATGEVHAGTGPNNFPYYGRINFAP